MSVHIHNIGRVNSNEPVPAVVVLQLVIDDVLCQLIAFTCRVKNNHMSASGGMRPPPSQTK